MYRTFFCNNKPGVSATIRDILPSMFFFFFFYFFNVQKNIRSKYTLWKTTRVSRASDFPCMQLYMFIYEEIWREKTREVFTYVMDEKADA